MLAAVGRPLDATDERIIQLLRADGRMPLVQLADEIGLSRSATQERLARLERDGVILGYTIRYRAPVPSPTQAWLILRFAPGIQCKDVVPALLRFNQVRRCDSLAGEIDLLLHVEVPDAAALMQLREQIIALYGVAEVTTAPVLAVHADHR